MFLLRSHDSVKHYEVKWNGLQYTFGIATFDTFDEFVQHFKNRPIIGGESGMFVVCTLNIFACPLCCDWFRWHSHKILVDTKMTLIYT